MIIQPLNATRFAIKSLVFALTLIGEGYLCFYSGLFDGVDRNSFVNSKFFFLVLFVAGIVIKITRRFNKIKDISSGFLAGTITVMFLYASFLFWFIISSYVRDLIT